MAQIRFNAWHYAETDLWASLATCILAGLAREVLRKPGRDQGSEPAKAEVAHAHATLLKALGSSQEWLDRARAHRTNAQSGLQRELEKRELCMKAASAVKAMRVLAEQPALKPLFDGAAPHGRTPAQIAEMAATYTTGQEIAEAVRSWGRRPMTYVVGGLTVLAAVAVSELSGLMQTFTQRLWAFVIPAVGALSTLLPTLHKLSKFVA